MNNLSPVNLIRNAEQMPMIPLTRDERTWYGFFMECFGLLANCFCLNMEDRSEQLPFRDVHLVSLGYYSLTEERLQEWGRKFHFIQWDNPSRGEVADNKTLNQTAHQLTANLILQRLRLLERSQVNDFTNPGMGLPSNSRGNEKYLLRSSDLNPEESRELEEIFREMRSILLKDEASGDELLSGLEEKYSDFINLFHTHIVKVLDRECKLHLSLQEEGFIENMLGDLPLTNEERVSVAGDLQRYYLNQTIVQNEESIAIEQGVKASPEMLEELTEKIKHFTQQGLIQEAENVFNTKKQLNLAIAQEEREHAYLALRNIANVIVHSIHRDTFPFPNLYSLVYGEELEPEQITESWKQALLAEINQLADQFNGSL